MSPYKVFALLTGIAIASVAGQSSTCFPGLFEFNSQINTFMELLNSSSTICSEIQKGNITVLAPSDKAFAAFNASNSDFKTPDQIEALLQYHVVHGTFSLALLEGDPVMLTTFLENPLYANVTGGQRLEASGFNNGTAAITSAFQSQSHIIKADTIFSGGYLQVIDSVLTIPRDLGTTITENNLTDYVALGVKTGLNQAVQSYSTHLVTDPDLTIFGPNSPNFSSNYTGYDGFTADEVTEIMLYHILNGTLLYKPMMVDGATFQTQQGGNITVYVVGNETYINDAKVTIPDMFMQNGVLQAIDRPLNPKNTTARPPIPTNSSTPSPSSSSSSGLSTGAKAGIGIGVALVVVALGWAAIAYRKKRHARDSGSHGSADVKGNGSYTTSDPSIPYDPRLPELSPEHLREMEGEGRRNTNRESMRIRHELG